MKELATCQANQQQVSKPFPHSKGDSASRRSTGGSKDSLQMTMQRGSGTSKSAVSVKTPTGVGGKTHTPRDKAMREKVSIVTSEKKNKPKNKSENISTASGS